MIKAVAVDVDGTFCQTKAFQSRDKTGAMTANVFSTSTTK